MRELGRKGGRKSPRLGKLPKAERQSLRAYLREEVDPAEVWQALKAALESENQTAKVGAARVLLQELYEEKRGEDDVYKAEIKGAADKFMAAMELHIASVVRHEPDLPYEKDFRRAVARGREEHEAELQAVIGQLMEKVTQGLRLHDVGDLEPATAEAVLQHLEECGVLVPGHR